MFAGAAFCLSAELEELATESARLQEEVKDLNASKV